MTWPRASTTVWRSQGDIESLVMWPQNLGSELTMVLNCAVNMLMGGALALYIGELYKRLGTSISNRDNFSGVFPMLTMVTVVIIFVVKSSLALSLGLVGALSIVRFRAAIKTSEELVYLFLCIGVGLALGAEHRLLAAVAVVIVTIFVVGRRFLGRSVSRQNLLLTVIGDAERFVDTADEANVVEALERLTGGLSIQRFDLEDGQVQIRAKVSPGGPEETTQLITEIKKAFPHLQVSYVNLDSLV